MAGATGAAAVFGAVFPVAIFAEFALVALFSGFAADAACTAGFLAFVAGGALISGFATAFLAACLVVFGATSVWVVFGDLPFGAAVAFFFGVASDIRCGGWEARRNRPSRSASLTLPNSPCYLL